jgi:predicted SnoaL-like aldol condensation-catalyzing enzyme
MKIYLVVSFLIGFPAAVAAQPGASAPEQRSSGSAAMSQQELNKALILRFYEEVWHKDNFEFADGIFAPDYARHDPGALVEEQRAQRPRQSELARQLKRSADVRFTFDIVLAEHDLVGVRWTARITPQGFPKHLRALVGKRGSYDSSGVNIFRVRNGKVVEIWNNRDDLTNLREAGLFRWYVIGGFVGGFLAALFVSWLLRRWCTYGSRTMTHQTT